MKNKKIDIKTIIIANFLSKISLEKKNQTKRDQNNFCIATKTLLQNKYLLLHPLLQKVKIKMRITQKALMKNFVTAVLFILSYISKVYNVHSTAVKIRTGKVKAI